MPIAAFLGLVALWRVVVIVHAVCLKRPRSHPQRTASSPYRADDDADDPSIDAPAPSVGDKLLAGA